MRTIGLTGIFGSGKSSVAKIFKGLGIPVVSCDKIARAVLIEEPVKESLRKEFGSEIFFSNGRVDRSQLARISFANPHATQRLNEIVHPRVFELLRQALDNFSDTDKIVVVEIPLLFETRSEHLFDIIITVTAPLEIIKRRLSSKFSEDDITRRWQAQIPLDEKTPFSDFIIDNGISRLHTRTQVQTIVRGLIHGRRNETD
ncbi:MAG: dephospho-CoA kinase [Candidatus Ratteibacteria bacterium]